MDWIKSFGIDFPDGEFDVLAIGETVVDLISHETTDDLFYAKRFDKFQGGSPANIAMNVAKLAGEAAVVSVVGKDGFGRYIRESMQEIGVNTEYLFVDESRATTVNIISRSAATADSIHIRSADSQLSEATITEEMVQRAKIVHASAFALSNEPARSAVIKALKMAKTANKLVSFDPNYNPIDWPAETAVLDVLANVLAYCHVIKPSLDDAERLFGKGLKPQEYIARYHALGPKIVIFTMGNQGAILSDGINRLFVKAKQIQVVDATGAGDALWAGFIVSLLDRKSLLESVLFGMEIVELGLATVGPIQGEISREAIYKHVEHELIKVTGNEKQYFL